MLRRSLVFCVACLSALGCEPDSKIVNQDNDGDGVLNVDDCADEDPEVHPGAVEICDGIDNNCDGLVDDADPALDPATGMAFHADADGDLRGDPGVVVYACQQPPGHVLPASADDCDDGDPLVNPLADERCDGVDNDCDGDIDDDDTAVTDAPRWYRDDDGDGFGDRSDAVDACVVPVGFTAEDGDCDDGDDSRHPDAVEVCDDIDNDCDALVDDADSSLDAATRTDFYADADGDGHGDPDAVVPACELRAGIVATADDCEDGDPAVSPDAAEVCDGIDNDCDGDIDDADTSVDLSTGTTFYADRDGDGEGDALSTTAACAQPVGHVGNDTDCDDTDAARNSMTAWYPDSDGDGHGAASATPTVQCLAPTGAFVRTSTDCDDSAAAVFPGAAEVCDEVDNDCDGTVDDGVTTTYFADADADSYGDPARTTAACSAPSGYVENDDDCDDSDDTLSPETTWYLDADSDGYGGSATATQCTAPTTAYTRTSGDCDDADATSSPGGTEYCDGADNDCDGTTDEGVTTTYYRDVDGDGYGTPGTTTEDCAPPTGYATTADDCDDGDGLVNPGATEICNGSDDDCDGDTDDDDASLDTSTATTWYADSDGDGEGDSATTALSCDLPAGHVGNSDDCDDTDAALYTGTVWYLDSDGDGFGDDSSTVTQCSQPTAVYALAGGDCDVSDSGIYPGAAESCDGVDEDCDGTVDNGVTTDFYPDLDGDGFGDAGALATAACAAASGEVADNTDCDDSSALVFPGATELCDGVQNDCDDAGWVDDAGLVSQQDTALGTWSDVSTAWAAGTAASPASITVSTDSRLQVCAGTWYVALDVQADLDLTGLGGEAAVVLDGAGAVTPVAVTGTGLAVALDGLTLDNGLATMLNGSWPAHWSASSTTIGGNLYCEDSTLLVSNTTLSGGSAGVGGGLGTVDCDVALDTVTVTGNAASYNAGVSLFNGTTSATGLLVDGNAATTDGGGLFLGGPTGDHAVASSTLSNNTAGQLGGGLRILDAPAVRLTGLTVEDNSATDNGGGVYIASHTHDPVVDLSLSTLEGNTSAEEGGGIYLSDGELTLDTCELDSNSATNGGGGLTIGVGTDALIADTTFVSNTASYGSAIGAYGDTMDISGTSFTSNHATVAAAVNVEGAHLDITDSDFTTNTCDRSTAALRINQSLASATIDGVVFEANEGFNATSNGGGAALVLRYGPTVDITDSDFIDNVTHLTSGTSYGGGAIWSWTSSSNPRNTLTMYSVTATGNTSATTGGFLYGRLTDITMGNVTVDGNTASSGGGGALNLSAATLAVSNSSITNNSATGDGGGIHTSSSISLTATNLSIYGNSPDDTYVSSVPDSDTWGVNSSFVCTTTGGCY